MATKQTKFGTYLGPPEIVVKQGYDQATHETQVLGTLLGLFASIGQATTRNQVMT